MCVCVLGVVGGGVVWGAGALRHLMGGGIVWAAADVGGRWCGCGMWRGVWRRVGSKCTGREAEGAGGREAGVVVGGGVWCAWCAARVGAGAAALRVVDADVAATRGG